jgi:hypothetical protein
MFTSTTDRILATLELFARLHIAPTGLEVWRFLVRSQDHLSPHQNSEGELVVVPSLPLGAVSLTEVVAGLSALVLSGEVVERWGYYARASHGDIIELRWRGYRYGIDRERRIRRYAKFLQYIPFVRGVGLAGSQALGLQRRESDIDLLIITEPGWMWLPRTLVTAYFHVLGVRRHGQKIADRFCLNHYVMGPKRMESGRNWYTAFEYAKLRPLCGERALADFQQHNQQWVQAFFPNFETRVTGFVGTPKLQRMMELLCTNPLGRSLERMLERLQRPRIRTDEKYVIVERDELSFHPGSKQDAVLQK